ncbi:MAG TPA: hypothetical protein PLX31_07415, partial [Gemmatimonadaceae bacterium]|nr:hypothetical protein [Gemmatimonadaceae bacterium]
MDPTAHPSVDAEPNDPPVVAPQEARRAPERVSRRTLLAGAAGAVGGAIVVSIPTAAIGQSGAPTAAPAPSPAATPAGDASASLLGT